MYKAENICFIHLRIIHLILTKTLPTEDFFHDKVNMQRK
jgi:hypothetical protein